MRNIYIVSRGNPERMHTAKLLHSAGIPFELVVDDQQQVSTCRSLGYAAIKCPFTDIVAKRNWISLEHGRSYTDPWYIGMDDNIQDFTMVAPEYRDNLRNAVDDGTNWRPRYNQTVNPTVYLRALEALIALADKVGAPYGGVATMENPFFRATRHSFRRFVKTKVFIMNSAAGIMFKHTMCHDSYATALAIAKHGRVVVDNYMFYKANWYEKGGLGDRKAREEKGLLTQLQECVDEFPGLVALARGKNSALRVCKVNDNSVNTWRRANGYL